MEAYKNFNNDLSTKTVKISSKTKLGDADTKRDASKSTFKHCCDNDQHCELYGPGKGCSPREYKVLLTQAKQMGLAYTNKSEYSKSNERTKHCEEVHSIVKNTMVQALKNRGFKKQKSVNQDDDNIDNFNFELDELSLTDNERDKKARNCKNLTKVRITRAISTTSVSETTLKS